jgi:phosphate/sulfate permease
MLQFFTLPSVMAHTLNGGLMILALVLAAMNYRVISRLPVLQMITLVLILSIAVGVHGISHAGLESAYGYNPLKIFGF